MPLRLVRVIDRLNVGGPTHHVLLLTRDMAPRGYHTVLVKGQVASGEAEMAEVIDRVGVGFVEIKGLSKIVSLRDMGAFRALYRLIRQMRPHVVHTHKAKAGALGRIAAWLAGVPVVVHTFHGHTFHGYFSPFKSFLFVAIERVLAHWTNAIVTVSAQQRRELRTYRIASPTRLHAIPLGLDLAPFVNRVRGDDGFRAELGFSSDVPLVGLVGRLTPIKGIDLFLKAAQKVIAQMPDVRFVVVGDGELRTELEQLSAALGLVEYVRFTGFRSDMPRIYGALDLVALSSHNEGLPVTLIEALATGCYAVATRVGGVPDLLDTSCIGMVAPPDNVLALSLAISQALRTKQQVQQKDRQRIGRLYSVERLVDDLDCLYRTLLETNKRVCLRAGSAWEGVCK